MHDPQQGLCQGVPAFREGCLPGREADSLHDPRPVPVQRRGSLHVAGMPLVPGDYAVRLKGGVRLKVSRSRFEALEKRMGLAR